MSSTIANVVENDGKYSLDISESSQQTERKTGSSLDKEDFLRLLVTQMQYQDPLSPMENTEYVAQLAQFSELEQMTNLNSTMSNNSAYTLTGKYVLVREISTTGEVQEFTGKVDSVTLKNGDAYVTIDGSDYAYDDVVQVIDESYYVSQYIPSVTKQSFEYHHQNPQDIRITGIDLGSNGYQATSFAVVLVDAQNQTAAVDTKYLNYKNGTLTIDREAFAQTDAGKYTIAFVFDDANKTMDYESITMEVKGIVEKTDSDKEAAGDNAASPDETAEEETTV